MKNHKAKIVAIAIAAVLIAATVIAVFVATYPPSAHAKEKKDSAKLKTHLYQIAMMNSLLSGNYEGLITLGKLKRHGNFGIGTFDALNGEMVAFDGEIYQVTSDGKVRVAPNETTTPFALVTWFKPDKNQILCNINISELQQKLALDFLDNQFYAIRIDGSFAHMTTRVVPAQSKPYRPMSEAARYQPEFNFTDIEGTLIAFYSPTFSKSFHVPGWHWHFLNDSKTSGGHVLDFEISLATAKYQQMDQLVIDVPYASEPDMSNPAINWTPELKEA